MISKKIHHSAFTLIELMVVVAIIAILTGIITANFAASKSESRDAKRIADMAAIQLALEQFADRCGGYPQPSPGGTPRPPLTSYTITTCPTGITLGSFITVMPSDPGSYTYSYGVTPYTSGNLTTPATDYVLRAQLENNNAVLTGTVTGTKTDNNINCNHSVSPWYYCVQPR